MLPVLLFVLPVFAIASWIIYSSVRALVRGEVAAVWRQRAIFCVLIGVALGIWLAFFAEFQPAENARFLRAPVPTLVFQKQKDVWSEVSPPAPVRVLAMITDFISGIAAGLLPIKIAAFVRQVKESVGR